MVSLFLVRRSKRKKIRRQIRHQCALEFAAKLQSLNDAAVRAVVAEISRGMPDAKELRLSSPGRAGGTPSRSRGPTGEPVEPVVGSHLAALLSEPIFVAGDSAMALCEKILAFAERSVLPYVAHAVRGAHSALEKVIAVEGRAVFDYSVSPGALPADAVGSPGDSAIPVLPKCYDADLGTRMVACPWRLCCIFPGAEQDSYEYQRVRFFRQLALQTMEFGKAGTNSSCALPVLPETPPAEEAEAFSLTRESPDQIVAGLVVRCQRRRWLPQARQLQGEDALLLKATPLSATFEPLVSETVESLTAPPCTSFGRCLLGSLSPTTAAAGPASLDSPPLPRPISAEVYDGAHVAFNQAADEHVFGPSGLRTDLHTYFQCIKHLALCTARTDVKNFMEIYELVPRIDREAKRWAVSVIHFLAVREAHKWRQQSSGFLRSVVAGEMQLAQQRLASGEARRLLLFGNDDGDPAASVGGDSLDVPIDLSDRMDEARTKALARFKGAFLKRGTADAPETRAACCQHCLPELPALRTEVPTGEEAVEKALLQECTLALCSACARAEDTELARVLLRGLRRKTLDLLYPAGAAWPTMADDAPLPGSASNASRLMLPSPLTRDASLMAAGGDDAVGDGAVPAVRSWGAMVQRVVMAELAAVEDLCLQGMARKEKELAAQALQCDPAVAAQLREGPLAAMRDIVKPWGVNTARWVTLLKRCQRCARDLCDAGRQLQGVYGATSRSNLAQLLTNQRGLLATLREECPSSYWSWLPLGDVVASFNHWATQLGTPLVDAFPSLDAMTPDRPSAGEDE